MNKFDKLFESMIEEMYSGEKPPKIPSNYKKLKGLKRDLLLMDITGRMIHLNKKLLTAYENRREDMPTKVLELGDKEIQKWEKEISELTKIKDQLK